MTVTRQPTWAASRDPIFTDVAKRQARDAAIQNLWVGGLPAVWADIVHNKGHAFFIPAWVEFLKHT